MPSAIERWWTRLAGPLLGRRVGRPSHAGDWYLPIAMIPYVIGLAAFLLITVVVDPYDLRPWGLSPRLATHRYPDDEAPLFIKVLARGGYDTVLIGGSTVMQVTTEQLRRAFGPQSRPVNLAYEVAAPEDTRETLAMVERMPRLRRVVVTLDPQQMIGMGIRFPPAQKRRNVITSNWAHAGDFNITTARAALSRLLDGVYDLPAWRKAAAWPTFADDQPAPSRMTPELLANDREVEAAAARISRDGAAALGPLRCERFPVLQQVLAPAIARLTARGVTVDVLVPPTALAEFYNLDRYAWMTSTAGDEPFEPGAVFPQMVVFKACVLKTVEALGPRVRLTAVDNDLAITGERTNFTDGYHLHDPRLYQRVLDHVAAGDAQLTSADFDDYARTLARNVLSTGRTIFAGSPGRAAP